MAAIALLAGSALTSLDRPRSPVTPAAISGTVAAIDTPALRMRMHIEAGPDVSLTVANVDAMQAVHAGDHVQIDVDESGVVLNINRITPPPRPTSYSRG